MSRVVLFGTGAALADPDRENTYMLLQGATLNILVDCAGSPSQHLMKLGISPATIDHVILTHMHPDHIYGWPLFVLNTWMIGRRAPLHVYGLHETLKTARGMLRAMRARDWPHMLDRKSVV